MNSISTKIILILSVVLLVFIGLWRMSLNKLEKVEQELDSAQATIEVLKKDNSKLIKYTKEKDKEINHIIDKYSDKLNNVPSDSCGDVKPSKKLLDFLRKK